VRYGPNIRSDRLGADRKIYEISYRSPQRAVGTNNLGNMDILIFKLLVDIVK